jgi:hypothetical protein
MYIAILSLGLFAAAGAIQAEAKIDVKELPKPVSAAVKAKFPKAKITEASKEEENHKVIYEVVLADEGSKVSLAVSAKGKILEIEKPIGVEKLPKAVQATLAAKYSKAKIKAAEEVLKFENEDEDDDKPGKKEEKDEDDDKPTKIYEVVLASEGKGDVEVKFSATGKVIEKEDEDDDKSGQKEKDEEDDKPGKKKEKVEG